MKTNLVFGSELAERLKDASVICEHGKRSFTYQLPYEWEDIKTPKEGMLYHIRDVVEAYDGVVGVLLVEVVNEKILHRNPTTSETCMHEPVFAINRFRFL